MSEWINVEDRLPDHNEIVLVFDEIGSVISMAKFRQFDEPINFDDQDCWYVMNIDNLEIDYQVTHWMPLPKPPEKI